MSKKIEIFFWLGALCFFLLLHKFILRDSLIGVINETLPSREAGLLAGMVWGDKTGFGIDFYTLLQNTGIVHLVVVSGTNVMLIATLFIENLAYILSRRRAIIVGMGLIWWYALMVGMDPPVIRAGLLLTVFYGAQFLGRKFDVWRALGLVVGVMMLADWRMLWSLSFWLSVGAFVGVLTMKKNHSPFGLLLPTSGYLWTLTREIWWRMPLLVKGGVRGGFDAIWISLWITPLLAITFGKISIVSPIINALVVGLVEIITLLGLAGTIIHPILWLAYPLLHYVVWLVELVGEWRWASVSVSFNWWILAGWYLILLFFMIKKQQKF